MKGWIILSRKKRLRILKKEIKKLQLEYNSYDNTLAFLNKELVRVDALVSITKEDKKYEKNIIRTKIKKVTKKMERVKEELDELENSKLD